MSTDKEKWYSLDTTTNPKAAKYDDGYAIYLRGIGNSSLSDGTNAPFDCVTATGISISGDSRNLLNYSNWSSISPTTYIYSRLLCRCITDATDFNIHVYNVQSCCNYLGGYNTKLIYGCTFSFNQTSNNAAYILRYAFRNCTSLKTRYQFTGITFSGTNCLRNFYETGASIYSSSGTGHTKAYKIPNASGTSALANFAKKDTATATSTFTRNTTMYVEDDCIVI